LSRAHHIRTLKRRLRHLVAVQITKSSSATAMAYNLAEANALRWVLKEIGEAPDDTKADRT